MPKGRVYKTKAKGAQEAHEAIRPTSFARDPESLRAQLKADELRLYRLIWQRALASPDGAQGARDDHGGAGRGPIRAARLGDADAVRRLLARSTPRARTTTPPRRPSARCRRSPRATSTSVTDVTPDPALHRAAAALHRGDPDQGARGARHRPPVDVRGDDLDDRRPRLRRGQGAAAPPRARSAEIVTDLLVEHFGEFVDLEFTARMEEELDEVARGEREWVPLLREFYGPFKELRRREAQGAQARRLHDRADRRGLLRGPPDGHPARAQRPVPGLLAVPEHKETRPLPGEEPPRRVEGDGRDRARSAARGRSSTQRGRFGRVRRLLALPGLQVHPARRARRRPTSCRSRSPAPRAPRATSSRVARGAPGTSSGAAPLPQVRLHDHDEPTGAVHDADRRGHADGRGRGAQAASRACA